MASLTSSAPPNHVLQQVYKRFLAFRERHAAEEEECRSAGGGGGGHKEDQGECGVARLAARADDEHAAEHMHVDVNVSGAPVPHARDRL